MYKKALVVDDSPVDLAHLKSILTDAGCLVNTAVSGRDALAKAAADRPDIVFLDVVMPDMDGYEACRMLVEDPVTQGIPVVLVTSKGQKADQLWGQMQGARAHLVKPVSSDRIIDQLKALT